MERTLDLEQLKTRVKQGNEKLNAAWDNILKIDHNSQRWKDEVERWHQANERLSELCLQLEVMGYEDCLYLLTGEELASMSPEAKNEILQKVEEGIYQKLGNKIKTKGCLEGLGCRVCPSKISYWEPELMNLPSPKR